MELKHALRSWHEAASGCLLHEEDPRERKKHILNISQDVMVTDSRDQEDTETVNRD